MDSAQQPRRSFGPGALPGAGWLVDALDHVLAQNEWARDRLLMHGGKLVEIGLDAAPTRVPEASPSSSEASSTQATSARTPRDRLLVRIGDDGRLRRHRPEPSEEPQIAARMLLKPSVDAAFAFLREGPTGLSRHLKIDGDVMLAGALGEIAARARWDVTEDLSRVVGDVAADRIARVVSGARQALNTAAGRMGEHAARYASTEAGWVAERAEIESLDLRLDALEARIDALEQAARLNRDR